MIEDLDYIILSEIFVIAQNPHLSTVCTTFYNIAITTAVQVRFILYGKKISKKREFFLEFFEKYPRLSEKKELGVALFEKRIGIEENNYQAFLPRALTNGWDDSIETYLHKHKLIAICKDENISFPISSSDCICRNNKHQFDKPEIENLFLHDNSSFKLSRNICQKCRSKLDGKNVVFRIDALLDLSSKEYFVLQRIGTKGNIKTLEIIKNAHNIKIDAFKEYGLLNSQMENKKTIVSIHKELGSMRNYPNQLLYSAIDGNNTEIVEYILKRFYLTNERCQYYLGLSVGAGHIEIFNLMRNYSKNYKINLNQLFKWGVSGENVEITKQLISMGMDIKKNININLARTFLFSTTDMAKFLIENGAKLKYSNYLPLRLSLRDGNTVMTKFYLDTFQSVKINVINSKLIQHALDTKKVDFIQLLVSYGVDITMGNDFALANAVKRDRLRVVEELLKLGADPLSRNGKIIKTALENNNLDTARVLLQNIKESKVQVPIKLKKLFYHVCVTKKIDFAFLFLEYYPKVVNQMRNQQDFLKLMLDYGYKELVTSIINNPFVEIGAIESNQLKEIMCK
ncbi:hypothetical protein BB559_005736 [Furculomyces boomerangus]|uniref:Uncharacterized protein n=1 Tax=Furculomyces boomerangus TaxID=61424 RepID=A0A2T9Y6T6_9FUNG|nr:hypothetical protein BB559_005736 [Furculomyces boomerangus]